MSSRREFLQSAAAVPFAGSLSRWSGNDFKQPFVHLHTHSDYSYPDAIARIPKLVAQACELGMNALALTDRGTLAGAVEFYRTCRKAGIKPIIGYEAFVSMSDHRDRTDGAGPYHNLTLLAQNRTGFQNLIRLSSIANTEGLFYRPQIDKQLLQEHAEGLICLSGFEDSELAELLRHGRKKEAEQAAAWYADVFAGRYFIEVRNHGTEEQRRLRADLTALAQRVGIPLVATHDVHYVHPEDEHAHYLVFCSETNHGLSEGRLLAHERGTFYLKSPAEMYAAFPGNLESMRRSQEIADMVNLEMEWHEPSVRLVKVPLDVEPEKFIDELSHTTMEQVAAVGLTQTLQPRTAVRQMLRILRADQRTSETAENIMWQWPTGTPLQAIVGDEAIIRAIEQEDPNVGRAVRLAVQLEGLVIRKVVHKRQLAVCQQQLAEVLPLWLSPTRRLMVTQWTPAEIKQEHIANEDGHFSCGNGTN